MCQQHTCFPAAPSPPCEDVGWPVWIVIFAGAPGILLGASPWCSRWCSAASPAVKDMTETLSFSAQPDLRGYFRGRVPLVSRCFVVPPIHLHMAQKLIIFTQDDRELSPSRREPVNPMGKGHGWRRATTARPVVLGCVVGVSTCRVLRRSILTLWQAYEFVKRVAPLRCCAHANERVRRPHEGR